MKTNANRIIVKKKKKKMGTEERKRERERRNGERKTERRRGRKKGREEKILSLREMQMEKLFSFSHEVLQETRLHFQTEFPISFQ